MRTIIIAIIVSVATFAPPTFQQCADAFNRRLDSINYAASMGGLSPQQAYRLRLQAIADYAACKEEAWQEYVRQTIHDAMDILFN